MTKTFAFYNLWYPIHVSLGLKRLFRAQDASLRRSFSRHHVPRSVTTHSSFL